MVFNLMYSIGPVVVSVEESLLPTISDSFLKNFTSGVTNGKRIKSKNKLEKFINMQVLTMGAKLTHRLQDTQINSRSSRWELRSTSLSSSEDSSSELDDSFRSKDATASLISMNSLSTDVQADCSASPAVLGFLVWIFVVETTFAHSSNSKSASFLTADLNP